MKLFIIRHGESIANAKGIHQGQRVDTGLSKLGKAQAKKIAERLKDEKFEAIYSSDLKRAKETAEIIAKPHKLKVISDKRLREFDTGDWTDLPDKFEKWKGYRISESERLGIKRWEVKMPGGESDMDHISRTEEFLKSIMKHKGNIAIIAHGGSNKIFLGITGYTPMEKMHELHQHNTCLNELEFDGKTWKTHRVNCTKHLEK
jgi:broad specificity phosphatase PhoE